MAELIECSHCNSTNVEYLGDDFDYDGNDNIWSWDRYFCLDCGCGFNVATNNPYVKDTDD